MALFRTRGRRKHFFTTATFAALFAIYVASAYLAIPVFRAVEIAAAVPFRFVDRNGQFPVHVADLRAWSGRWGLVAAATFRTPLVRILVVARAYLTITLVTIVFCRVASFLGKRPSGRPIIAFVWAWLRWFRLFLAPTFVTRVFAAVAWTHFARFVQRVASPVFGAIELCFGVAVVPDVALVRAFLQRRRGVCTSTLKPFLQVIVRKARTYLALAVGAIEQLGAFGDGLPLPPFRKAAFVRAARRWHFILAATFGTLLRAVEAIAHLTCAFIALPVDQAFLLGNGGPM